MLALLCAVFSTTWGQTGTLVSSLTDIEDGETYYIAALNSNKYYTVPKATIDGQTFTCLEGSWDGNNTLTPNSDSGEFVFTAVSNVTNAYYIYNTNLKKYLVATGSKKFGYVDNTSSDYGYWTFSNVSSGGFSGVFSVQHDNKTHYMRAYNNSVRCYDGESNKGVYFFVKGAATNYTITAQSNNTEYGTVSVNGNTITATPASGYRVSKTTPYEVTSGTATVTQNGNIFTVTASSDCTIKINFEEGTDFASLPFEFDSGRSAIENTDGLTHYGLGDDYTNSPKLKFDTQGDYLILHFNERPGTLTFDIKGNSFSGGTFTVQISADGKTYNELQSYTTLGGSTQSITFSNLDENVRYIKWVYTNRSSGNVALGNIKLTNYKINPGLAFNPTTLEINIGDEFREPILSNQYNVTVTYNSNNTSVAEVAADGKLTIKNAGTATITASFAGDNTYEAGEAFYTLTVIDPNAPGTEDNPYTVEGAITFISTLNGITSEEVYVKGIISQIDRVSVNGTAQYWISDDGTTTTQLEIFSGKYLEGANFTSSDQIQLGDQVLVKGKLKLYNNTINEFDSGSVIVELIRKEAPELSYDETSFIIKPGKTFTAPTLNNPHSLPVTYSSSDETIATVNENTGDVTISNNEGVVTITASFAGNDTYRAGSTSYTITISDSHIYYKVTSADQIVAGKEYIIVCDEFSVAMGGQGPNYSYNYREPVDVTINADKVIVTTEPVVTLTLGGSEGAWTLKASDTKKFITTTDNNELLNIEDATNNSAKWTINKDEYGGYEIRSANVTTRYIQYNNQGSTQRFATYKGTQKKAYLYIKEEPITATFNHKYKGFTSIYYADKNLKVPADVTAHTYEVVNGKGKYITNIPAEGVIPAGTPVILEYGKSFTEAVTVTFEEVESAEPLNDGNMLRGSDDVDSNGLTTAPGNGKQADYYYYVLSVGKSSENANKIGFYWKLEDGGPFTPTPHKIYLALLQSEVDANNASIISIYDSDGIDSIAASDYTTQDVYSLSGVRMNGKDLPKGIYIIGGKKVVIK